MNDSMNDSVNGPVTNSVTIHTDGACSGNPGPGGFAAVIERHHRGDTLTVTGGDPSTTNNRMELSAVIEAVRAVNSVQECRDIPLTIRSDSQYVINAFNENWIGGWMKNNWRTAKKKPVLNRELWEDLLAELSGHPCTFVWVRGHSGDPMNELCDRLAVEQAAFAPSTDAYWVSAGNPRTAAQKAHDAMAGPDPAPETQAAPNTGEPDEPYTHGGQALAAARKAVRLLEQDRPEEAHEALKAAMIASTASIASMAPRQPAPAAA